MKSINRAALFAVGLMFAAQAKASDKQDFPACDGRIDPGKQDDGMRGVAGRGAYGISLFSQGGSIAACSRALASPRLLPSQHLRRAHLLRARGAAFLREGMSDKALADFDQAEAAGANMAGDRFYDRSMKVSIRLLRAIAQVQLGHPDQAMTLATEAMQARPYSLAVQRVGADIIQSARPLGGTSSSPWLASIRLEPDAALKGLTSEAEIGNFAGVVALRPSISVTWPDKPLQAFALGANTPEAMALMSGLVVTLHTAYARAATGDVAGARRDLAEVREKMNALRPVATAGGAVAPMSALLDKYADTRSRLVEARIAVAEKRTTDAIRGLVDLPLPRSAASVELLTAIKAATPAKGPGAVPEVGPLVAEVERSRRQDLTRDIAIALIAPETPRAVVDYESARPNVLGALVNGAFTMGFGLLGGIDRTDGFRSTAKPDGTTTVEFVGNTPSEALVQEMTLLRAAEVTRASGKTGFVIADRKDFTRTLTTTRAGMPISSVPTGFKTELTIKFVDQVSDPARQFDALAVIDALGPFYYEDKASGTRPSRTRR